MNSLNSDTSHADLSDMQDALSCHLIVLLLCPPSNTFIILFPHVIFPQGSPRLAEHSSTLPPCFLSLGILLHLDWHSSYTGVDQAVRKSRGTGPLHSALHMWPRSFGSFWTDALIEKSSPGSSCAPETHTPSPINTAANHDPPPM